MLCTAAINTSNTTWTQTDIVVDNRKPLRGRASQAVSPPVHQPTSARQTRRVAWLFQSSASFCTLTGDEASGRSQTGTCWADWLPLVQRPSTRRSDSTLAENWQCGKIAGKLSCIVSRSGAQLTAHEAHRTVLNMCIPTNCLHWKSENWRQLEFANWRSRTGFQFSSVQFIIGERALMIFDGTKSNCDVLLLVLLAH